MVVIRWLTGACGLFVWREPVRYARKSRQAWGSTVVGAAGMAVEAPAADVGLAARAVVAEVDAKAAVSCSTLIGSPKCCHQTRATETTPFAGSWWGWQHRQCWWHRSLPPPHPRIHAAATMPNVCRTASVVISDPIPRVADELISVSAVDRFGGLFRGGGSPMARVSPRVGGVPGVVWAGMAWSGHCREGAEAGEDLGEQVISWG